LAHHGINSIRVDVEITNQALCVCTGLEAFVFVCIFNSLDVQRHNQGKCFHAGSGHKNGHSFSTPIEVERPPLNPNSWLRHLPMLFALDVLGEVVDSDTQRER
jgi:hypothetical protein